MQQQLSLLAAAITALAVPMCAYPCGDKLTMMGGGVSFDTLNPGTHPAKVIVYVAPDSALHASRASLQKKLERAGHKVSLVDSAERLQPVLQGGSFDVLLTTLTDARTATPVATGSRTPAMVSVIYRPASANVTGDSAAATCTTRADKGTQLLDAIDNVIASKGRNLRADCSPAVDSKST
jgi:hypothetical protein